MSYGLSICWRGPPGSGKRNALQTQLAAWAQAIGQLYVVKRQDWDAPLQGGDGSDVSEEGADGAEDGKALLPMESSVLHWGFDVARMSLQDKQYVKCILQRWGRGSQVLSQGHNQRCLIFYHAHLLSSESVLFLQAFLEENHQDSVLWFTSEHPLPARLADWCVEIPVAGEDKALQKFTLTSRLSTPIKTLEDEIEQIYRWWMAEPPKLSDVKKIRGIVYGLLHRNIRWTDGFHIWMFVLDKLPLTHEQKRKLAQICIKQPFTGAGQTVPSYRIPVLWEHYLCSLRNALAPPMTPEAVLVVPKNRKTKQSKSNGSANITS
jgi:hypothetical protein